MSSAEPPPPPPPPPPPGYEQSYGGGYDQAYGSPPGTRVVPPPLPEIDAALIRPSTAWYWVAGAIGGVLILVSTVLSVIGTLETDAETSLGLSAVSWLLYVAGGGIAAIIGGITWSRRSAHKRRLQREEMIRRGQA